MVNELSRFGDQLPRARHRTSSSLASVLIAPPARREPTHTALARTADRELYAEADRSPRALVSIHVEVTHPQEVEPIEAQLEEVVEAQSNALAPTIADREPARVLQLKEESPPLFSAAEAAPQLSTNAFTVYAAERGFTAYAAHGGFASAPPASGTRLLNVRA